MTENNKYLITSALPYINGIKHLGNLVGSMLPADVYARFLRQQGHDVLFICATDEHGTPAELGAAQERVDVRTYCDRLHKIQADIYKEFGLSFDFFGRTSNPQNHELTQYFGNKLIERGIIEEGNLQQFYSQKDGRFLPDRYVEGECPYCHYDKARGDQCESCTKVLDPKDLINPRSAISGDQNLELKDSKHLFLKLSNLSGTIRDWVNLQKKWSPLVKSIALKWLDEGLRDRCITRDLKWGVPVNRPDFEDKVYYVWFDAPIGYIAATKEWADHKNDEMAWKNWWYGDQVKNIEYTQFMAKDNVPFHTISFPATLLLTGEPWLQATDIKGFNWLTYYGGKFSTSQKRGVFLDQALEILPPDYWRYYLMARAPEGSDSNFTWQDLQILCNKDLADVLGNFINRLVKFSKKFYDNELPKIKKLSEADENFIVNVQKGMDDYSHYLYEKDFRKATSALRYLWTLGNQYLADEAPWSNPERRDTIIRIAFNYVGLLSRLSSPIIPFTSKKLAALVQEDSHNGWQGAKEELTHTHYASFSDLPEILFSKIEDDQVALWEEKYGM